MAVALPYFAVANTVTHPPDTITPPSKGVRLAAFAGLVFAILQSACAAVLAISGVRVAIGLGALAIASGTYAPARGFHQDAIRIPMLILGSLGAIINLAVIFHARRLRARASAAWRRRTLSKKERRSERLQIILAAITLLLVTAEVITHPMMHKVRPAEPAATTRAR